MKNWRIFCQISDTFFNFTKLSRLCLFLTIFCRRAQPRKNSKVKLRSWGLRPSGAAQNSYCKTETMRRVEQPSLLRFSKPVQFPLPWVSLGDVKFVKKMKKSLTIKRYLIQKFKFLLSKYFSIQQVSVQFLHLLVNSRSCTNFWVRARVYLGSSIEIRSFSSRDFCQFSDIE